MAAKVLEIINIPDDSPDDDDDEISVIYATPSSAAKRGTTKSDPISVDGYSRRPKPETVINLSQESDDDLKLLYSRKRGFEGECSNSKSAPITFLCEICTDKHPQNQEFRVLGCAHSYCSDCMRKYVSSKLQDNVIDIHCPVSGCKGFMNPLHCRSILPKQVFNRWGDALCEAMFLPSEKFYCPFKDCSALLVDDLNGECGVIDQSVCPYCNRLFCAQCKVPWHVGMGCGEFKKLGGDERSSEDIMLMNLAKKKNWQRCPNPSCRFFVERSEGCLFMQCRCGYTFCYNCGAPMKEHYCNNCKH